MSDERALPNPTGAATGDAAEQNSAARPRPIDEVEHELCALAGQIAAATARFLAVLADFDERRGWAGDGIVSCAHWLSWRCGLSLVTAREHVRVARRLGELPRTAEEFADGKLSYSKVRAICRVATPATESDLVHAALHAPAAHLERLVRTLSHVVEEGENAGDCPVGRRHDRRPEPSELRLSWRWTDNGCLAISGLLSAEDGAALLAAAEASAQALHARRRVLDGNPSTDGEQEPVDVRAVRSLESGMFSSRVVGALSGAAADQLGHDGGPRIAHAGEVMVHVDADLLTGLRAEVRRTSGDTGAPGRSHLDNGPALTLAVVERLACDGAVRLTTHGSDGRTLDVGRRRRPRRTQIQALVRRDGGCAAPGCGRLRFLHAHHVVFWARGGDTTMDNLIMLCGEHHRLVHDDASPDQLTIEACGRQRFRFRSKDGREISQAPACSGDAEQVHRAYGHVAPDAIVPRWDGSSIDHDWFVHSYATKRTAEIAKADGQATSSGDDSAESSRVAA